VMVADIFCPSFFYYIDGVMLSFSDDRLD